MDPTAIEELLMPITYGRHLARRFPVGPLLAGTGLSAADIEERARRITVRQALQYIRNALARSPTNPIGTWPGRARSRITSMDRSVLRS